MKCEDLQFSLPLFADDDLSSSEKFKLKEHLAQCPVCREKHAEYVALRNNLRSLARPSIPADLTHSVRSAVALQLNQSTSRKRPLFSDNFREWLQYRLMPYGIGTFASLVFVIIFLTAMLSTKNATNKITEVAALNSKPAVVLTNSNSNFNEFGDPIYRDLSLDLTDESFAALRVPVSYESPSLNPKGALVAMTKSLARGKMHDDEVVLVTDVFSNGLAQIAEVVEPPRNRQSLEELEKALQNDPAYAPFVPAKFDNRSNVIRVVFKIQRVDVATNDPTVKKSSRK